MARRATGLTPRALEGFDPVRASGQITTDLSLLGRPERAVSERAYLKSDLEHFGTAVPDIRSVAKGFLKGHPQLTHDQLLALIDELWAAPIHERRMVSVELLVARQRLLGVGDLKWIESLLRAGRTWALVDTLAGSVVARIVDADPAGLLVLDRWLVDDNMWIRRSSVLGLRSCLRDGRELDRFVRYADVLLPEREFFIRKVLGWVAREVGQRQPEVISMWLRRNLHRMNHVTLREAIKYLPDGDQIVADWRRNKVG